jgi:hypothetical protein
MSSTPYTVETVQGVPFWKDSQNVLYLYQSSPPVRVGTYNTEKKEGSLDDDWKQRADTYLLTYRQSLGEFTEKALAQ